MIKMKEPNAKFAECTDVVASYKSLARILTILKYVTLM